MLLKMRGVPPKPMPRASDGMLLVWGDSADDKVREWYEGIGITVQELQRRREARFEGREPAEWEGVFWSKIVGGVGV
jgi:hypothetical protein